MYTPSPKLSYEPPEIKGNQELHVARDVCKIPLDCEDRSHFSNWGSRKPMTNWPTSTMNLSPALALPPIGSRNRSLRCSIIDRTKSTSSSRAECAKACTVCASTVEYGKNDGEDARSCRFSKMLASLAFEGKVSAFTQGGASYLETYPWTDKLKISHH